MAKSALAEWNATFGPDDSTKGLHIHLAPTLHTSDGAIVRAWVELPGVGRRKALEAWTEPKLLKDWWGGELHTQLMADDPYVVRFTGLGQTMRGRVIAYEPGNRLAFTWEWDHETAGPPRKVDIRVADVDGGSRIEIEHGPYGETQDERLEAANSQEGWQHFLPRLASRMAANS